MHRLHKHDVVSINVPSEPGPGFGAVVLAFSERGIALECLERSRLGRMDTEIPGAFLCYREEGRLVALAGTLFQVDPPGMLRFQIAEPELYRNRGTRVGFEMPIGLRPINSETERAGTTVQIGPDGLLVECPLHTASGEKLHISFTAPLTGETIEAKAEVVRAAEGLIALQLPFDSHEARNALGDIVVAVSRAELVQAAVAPVAGPDF